MKLFGATTLYFAALFSLAAAGNVYEFYKRTDDNDSGKPRRIVSNILTNTTFRETILNTTFDNGFSVIKRVAEEENEVADQQSDESEAEERTLQMLLDAAKAAKEIILKAAEEDDDKPDTVPAVITRRIGNLAQDTEDDSKEANSNESLSPEDDATEDDELEMDARRRYRRKVRKAVQTIITNTNFVSTFSTVVSSALAGDNFGLNAEETPIEATLKAMEPKMAAAAADLNMAVKKNKRASKKKKKKGNKKKGDKNLAKTNEIILENPIPSSRSKFYFD